MSDDTASDAALVLAEEISANGPLAVQASKCVVADSRLWSDEEMPVRQDNIVDSVFASSDARVGAALFADKRASQWRGQ